MFHSVLLPFNHKKRSILNPFNHNQLTIGGDTLNKETLNIIEFYKIIDRIADFALTEDAKECISKIVPSTDYSRIFSLLNETSEAKEILTNSTSIPLLGISGIATILTKLSKEMVLQPDELDKIKHVLISTKKFKAFMQSYEFLAPTISQYVYSMYELPEIKEEISRCIYNGRVDDKASVSLAKIRKQIYITEGRIKSKLDSMIKSSNIKKHLQDNSVTVKNNRFVLPVKANSKNEIPGVVIEKSSTGSTFFIEPTAINNLQEELNQHKMDEENEIYQILVYLSSLILESEKEFQITLDTFITYDVIFAKAKYSKTINGNNVTINTHQYTHIINGTHPLLGKDAIPLNFEIGKDYKAVVITGPNTGGKTVALKTVALFTAMVQAGLHIPVDSDSQIAIFGDILADIGDGQSIEQSLSTFSSHIKKIINIVRLANKYTLVILDEIGSGTDPTEGEGLAIALLDSLYRKNSTLIASSHYSKVKEFAKATDGFINGKMHFDIDSLQPTYQLTIGEAGESNAFIIAMRLGLEPSIITKAHQITYNEDKDYQLLSDQSSKGAPSQLNMNKSIKKPKKINDEILKRITNTAASTDESAGNDNSQSTLDYKFVIGDQVYIKSLDTKALIFEAENQHQEIGVFMNKTKSYIHKRKIKLLIPASQLYPEGYDFDMIFKSKDYRKREHLLNRKFVKGYNVEINEDDL